MHENALPFLILVGFLKVQWKIPQEGKFVFYCFFLNLLLNLQKSHHHQGGHRVFMRALKEEHETE